MKKEFDPEKNARDTVVAVRGAGKKPLSGIRSALSTAGVLAKGLIAHKTSGAIGGNKPQADAIRNALLKKHSADVTKAAKANKISIKPDTMTVRGSGSKRDPFQIHFRSNSGRMDRHGFTHAYGIDSRTISPLREAKNNVPKTPANEPKTKAGNKAEKLAAKAIKSAKHVKLRTGTEANKLANQQVNLDPNLQKNPQKPYLGTDANRTSSIARNYGNKQV
jgi:hypothetical protein